MRRLIVPRIDTSIMFENFLPGQSTSELEFPFWPSSGSDYTSIRLPLNDALGTPFPARLPSHASSEHSVGNLSMSLGMAQREIV
jgi:hypothetical protein